VSGNEEYCSPEHTDSTAAVLQYKDASTEDFGIADARA